MRPTRSTNPMPKVPQGAVRAANMIMTKYHLPTDLDEELRENAAKLYSLVLQDAALNRLASRLNVTAETVADDFMEEYCYGYIEDHEDVVLGKKEAAAKHRQVFKFSPDADQVLSTFLEDYERRRCSKRSLDDDPPGRFVVDNVKEGARSGKRPKIAGDNVDDEDEDDLPISEMVSRHKAKFRTPKKPKARTPKKQDSDEEWDEDDSDGEWDEDDNDLDNDLVVTKKKKKRKKASAKKKKSVAKKAWPQGQLWQIIPAENGKEEQKILFLTIHQAYYGRQVYDPQLRPGDAKKFKEGVSAVLLESNSEIDSNAVMFCGSYWMKVPSDQLFSWPTHHEENNGKRHSFKLKFIATKENGKTVSLTGMRTEVKAFVSEQLNEKDCEDAIASKVSTAIVNGHKVYGCSWALDGEYRRPYELNFTEKTTKEDLDAQVQTIIDTHSSYVNGTNEGTNYFKKVTRDVVMATDANRTILELKPFTSTVLKDPNKPPPGYYLRHGDEDYEGQRKGITNIEWGTVIKVNGNCISIYARRIPFLHKIVANDRVGLKDERQVDHLTHFNDCWDPDFQDFTYSPDNRARGGTDQNSEQAENSGLKANIRPGPSFFMLGYCLYYTEGKKVGDKLESRYDK